MEGSSGGSLSEGALWREPEGRAPLLGTLKNMLNKVLELGVCFHTGPNFGEHRGMLLYLRLLREGEKILYGGKFYEKFEIYIIVPCKRAAFPIRALLGNLEGIRLLGLLREKENAYMDSFSWTQRTLKLSLGSSGNLARNNAPLS